MFWQRDMKLIYMTRTIQFKLTGPNICIPINLSFGHVIRLGENSSDKNCIQRVQNHPPTQPPPPHLSNCAFDHKIQNASKENFSSIRSIYMVLTTGSEKGDWYYRAMTPVGVSQCQAPQTVFFEDQRQINQLGFCNFFNWLPYYAMTQIHYLSLYNCSVLA